MTDKKLNEEQLDKVSGGKSLEEHEKPYRDKYRRKLNKYDTENYIGQNLYFTLDYDITDQGGSAYFHTFIFGTLNKSYEKSAACDSTKRTANVTVIISEGDHKKSGNVDISLDDWDVYAE